MMLAHSFKLLGLFFNLCIFASATPVDIDIVTSSPAALDRRVPQSLKNECPLPSHWVRRECQPSVSPRAYRDVCEYRRTSPNLASFFTYLRDECPENYICAPDQDDDGDLTIRCIPEDKEESSGSPKRKKQKVGGAEYGRSNLVTAHGDGSKTVEEEVDSWIDWDIAGASVSAVFTSTDNSFAVAPSNIIVGKIKGTEVTVCKGDMSDANRARECFPTGKHDLIKGQVVNFTFGLSGRQSGYLHWAIIPSVHDELR